MIDVIYFITGTINSLIMFNSIDQGSPNGGLRMHLNWPALREKSNNLIRTYYQALLL